VNTQTLPRITPKNDNNGTDTPRRQQQPTLAMPPIVYRFLGGVIGIVALEWLFWKWPEAHDTKWFITGAAGHFAAGALLWMRGSRAKRR
jgi:hypothetical protein